MKSTIYTIEDGTLGIVLTVEGELIDWEDSEPPEVIINEISYGDKPITMWAFNAAFIVSLQDKIFQQWCSEGAKK